MQSNKSRYFQFFLIVIAAGSIFPIIYLRQSYQETILEVFNISLAQLNVIYSVLGIAYVVGYFPSGVLSDKFSAKKLLALSLLGVSLGGFWFAQIPGYGSMIVCFVIWGTFSIFTFWSAHMKLVKLLAKKEEEGRFFGILDGGRGAVEALLALVAAAIFGLILGSSTDIEDKRHALVAVIYLYSFMLLATSILVAIFVKEDKDMAAATNREEDEPIKEKEKFHLSDMKDIFQNRTIFIMAAIIFFGYIVTWAFYYFGGYMQTNIGVSPVTVAQVMVVGLWMRPVGGILGGFLADRLGKENTLSGAFLICIGCLALIGVLPYTTSTSMVFAVIIVLSIFIFMIRGTYWSLLGECRIDEKITGVAIGTISLFGYLPDIVLPLIINGLFAKFGDLGGYNSYFIFSAAMGAAGLALVFLFRAVTRRRNAGLDAMPQ
ncbi:MAG: MFS transporter [Clostridiales bacterium]|nr:MFS transporter [Clostridiales bacterium]